MTAKIIETNENRDQFTFPFTKQSAHILFADKLCSVIFYLMGSILAKNLCLILCMACHGWALTLDISQKINDHFPSEGFQGASIINFKVLVQVQSTSGRARSCQLIYIFWQLIPWENLWPWDSSWGTDKWINT